MTESMDSREYVANWLRHLPDFMAELGIEDSEDLASRLVYMGSGGRADVIYLGERNGVKQVLKVTNDSAQGAMSMAAYEDQPEGIVPIYDVVETDAPPRVQLPELPAKGKEPHYVPYTWGVIEKLVVPLEALREMSGDMVAGESADVLLKRWAETWRSYESGTRHRDPLVEDWRLQYAAALEWVEETCEAIGSKALLDLHEGNFGVDPDTGELLLIDLGQCYAIDPVNMNPGEPLTVYYKGGARAERKLRDAFGRVGVQAQRHTTRKEALSGETDPHFRKHARASFLVSVPKGKEAEFEAALDDTGVDWSFYF